MSDGGSKIWVFQNAIRAITARLSETSEQEQAESLSAPDVQAPERIPATGVRVGAGR